MAFKVKGVDVFSDDGALSKESVIAARDGTATDITGSDELLLLDSDGGDDVMRVTVDELGSKFNAVAPGGLQYTFSSASGTNSTQPGQIRLNASQTIFAIHQDDRNTVPQSAFFGSLAPLTYLIYVSFDGGAGFFQGTYTDSTPDVFRFTSGTYAGLVPPDGANVEVTITPSSSGNEANFVALLDDVGDVFVTGAAEGQVLTRQGSQWVPATPSGGSGGGGGGDTEQKSTLSITENNVFVNENPFFGANIRILEMGDNAAVDLFASIRGDNGSSYAISWRVFFNENAQEYNFLNLMTLERFQVPDVVIDGFADPCFPPITAGVSNREFSGSGPVTVAYPYIFSDFDPNVRFFELQIDSTGPASNLDIYITTEVYTTPPF